MTTKTKYPRTKHIPQSPGKTSDDKVLKDLNDFIGKEVVITEKMDGENTSIYTDGTSHARSIDSKGHPSRHWLKGSVAPLVHQTLGHVHPNLRICGENLFAKHSIKYTNLLSYFYVFSVWDGNKCLAWKQTVGLAKLLELPTPAVFFEGILTQETLNAIIEFANENSERIEGFVIRNKESFDIAEFDSHVAKYVRAGHVQTDEHWMHQPIEKNDLNE